MEKEVIIKAASVEEALEIALNELGVEQVDVEIEILEEPSKKLFGGSIDAKIKVSIKDEQSEVEDETAEEDVLDSDITDKYEQVNEDHEDQDLEEGSDLESPDDDDLYSEEDERNFNEVNIELSDEELDAIADSAIETIRGILEYFGAEDTEIDEYEGEEGELILDIMGDNLAVLIGRHGKTLDAIQSLITSIVSKKTGFRYPVVVDVKGYKHRRKQKIIGIARASAARAIRQKHDVRLRPMSPYERRIVHIALREDSRVKTSSEGSEPNRYVIIQPL